MITVTTDRRCVQREPPFCITWLEEDGLVWLSIEGGFHHATNTVVLFAHTEPRSEEWQRQVIKAAFEAVRCYENVNENLILSIVGE